MQISPCGEIRIPALPLARYQALARSFAVPSVEGVHANSRVVKSAFQYSHSPETKLLLDCRASTDVDVL